MGVVAQLVERKYKSPLSVFPLMSVGGVGQGYFIQTPNRNFPIEPHFLLPLFQFYPPTLQAWPLTHRAIGHNERLANDVAARDLLAHTRMLTEKEFRALFPEASIIRETLLGMTKSFVALHPAES